MFCADKAAVNINDTNTATILIVFIVNVFKVNISKGRFPLGFDIKTKALSVFHKIYKTISEIESTTI